MMRSRRVYVGSSASGFDVSEFGPGGAPVVSILGGVHGDEYEGMLAAVRVLHALGNLQLGTVRVVTVCNEAAAERGVRASADAGGDLARAFPGNPTGQFVGRLAFLLGREVIEGSDLLIDLHSAGGAYAMLHLVGARRGNDEISRRSEAAARSLGAPALWLHDSVAPGRTLSHALAHGIPAIYVEHPGGGGVDTVSVDRTVDGVMRVLADLAMIPTRPPASEPEVVLVGNGDLDHENVRTDAGGLLWPVASPGDRVEQGQVLAEVVGPDGTQRGVVQAPRSGVVVMMRRTAGVEVGDRVGTVMEELI